MSLVTKVSPNIAKYKNLFLNFDNGKVPWVTVICQHITGENDNVELSFKDRNIIVLHDIETKKNISLQAKSILILGNLKTADGDITIRTPEGNTILLGASLICKGGGIKAKESVISNLHSDVKDLAKKKIAQAISKSEFTPLAEALTSLYFDYLSFQQGTSLPAVPFTDVLSWFGFQIPE